MKPSDDQRLGFRTRNRGQSQPSHDDVMHGISSAKLEIEFRSCQAWHNLALGKNKFI
jgi:hypothetical protein